MSEADLEEWARPCRDIARSSLAGENLDYGVFHSSGDFCSEAIITLIEDRKRGAALGCTVIRLIPV